MFMQLPVNVKLIINFGHFSWPFCPVSFSSQKLMCTHKLPVTPSIHYVRKHDQVRLVEGNETAYTRFGPISRHQPRNLSV